MTMTLLEIQERLKDFDETTILEVLEISSEDLIDRFVDIIEEKADKLESDVC
jgi:hypothetical protein